MKILTFDIEEWFHCDFFTDQSKWTNYEIRIHNSTDFILNALSERKINSTFFILGWIADKYPEVVKKIQNSGHEIGCHSYAHQLVTSMDYRSFKEDTLKSKKVLQDITGQDVLSYRAPGFSITEMNKWAFEVLLELGFENDCSVFPVTHDFGGFKSFGEAIPKIIKVNGLELKEFPLNTVSFLKKRIVFSGGGYFRLFPYYLIHHWSGQSGYMMAYLHPRDFDFGQPRLVHLPLDRKFKSYYGIKAAYPKFLNWITDFTFISLADATRDIVWSDVPKIYL